MIKYKSFHVIIIFHKYFREIYICIEYKGHIQGNKILISFVRVLES